MGTHKIYYHFTSDILRDGSPIPPVGKWLAIPKEKEIHICGCGLHASEHPMDALKYASGNMLHRVVLEQFGERDDDKVVARRRKIIASVDAIALLQRTARKFALDVIHLWKAPDVVREFLETGNPELAAAAARVAARAAARAAAAWAATAVSAAARAAAAEAVSAAAWEAARAAAWAAAREAFTKAQRDYFLSEVNKEFDK